MQPKNRKALLLTLIAAFAVTLPLVASNGYFIHLLVMALVYGVVAMGLNILTGYTGKLSLGHAGFFGVGAYVSALLSIKAGIPAIFSILLAGVAVFFLGVLLGLPTLRLEGHYLSIVTIGFNEVIILAIINMRSLTRGPGGLRGIPPLSIAGFEFTTDLSQYYFMLVFVSILLYLTSKLVKSHVGLALRAVMDGETASEACGVNVAYYRVFAFGISAMYAGLGGGVLAHFLNYISPYSFQSPESFALLGMLVVGGIGTLAGPVVGALIMTLLPEYLRAFADFRLIINGVLTIILLIRVPGGIVGLANDLMKRAGRRLGHGSAS